MSVPSAKIGWRSAAALMLANMISIGAFATLSLQLNLHNGLTAVKRLAVLPLGLAGALLPVPEGNAVALARLFDEERVRIRRIK